MYFSTRKTAGSCCEPLVISQQVFVAHLRFPPVWTILRWSEPAVELMEPGIQWETTARYGGWWRMAEGGLGTPFLGWCLNHADQNFCISEKAWQTPHFHMQIIFSQELDDLSLLIQWMEASNPWGIWGYLQIIHFKRLKTTVNHPFWNPHDLGNPQMSKSVVLPRAFRRASQHLEDVGPKPPATGQFGSTFAGDPCKTGVFWGNWDK